MAAIATVMRQASAMPIISELARVLPTMMATPHSATRLTNASRKLIQANAAATKGPVALMIATLDTLVSCRAGMKATMPNVDSDATSHPLLPIPVKSRRPARPCYQNGGDQTAAEQPTPEQWSRNRRARAA